MSYENRHKSKFAPATQSIISTNNNPMPISLLNVKNFEDYVVFHGYDTKYIKYRTRIDNVSDVNELIDSLQNKPNIIVRKHKTMDVISIFLTLYLLFVCLYFINKSRKISDGDPGKSSDGFISPKDKDYAEKRVLFDDVAGEDEAKESLQELVDFLHNPKKYSKIGAKLPKGALMVGSPGSGKTLLGKAIAGEANVPFFYRSASEFVEIFIGVGAKKIRELFAQAKKCSPCVIFIDEIDAIGGARGSYLNAGDSERDQTLNQLLTEMDGFKTDSGIIVIGATNRPEILDKALLRPGRFDRRIIVDKPDLKGRVDILKVHAKKVKLGPDVDFEALGLATAGLVGADLANIVNEGALLAVKNGKSFVCQDDLMKSIELVLIGKEKKNRVLNDEEKRTVAVHETGHALLGYLQTGTEPVAKISIIPTVSGALGWVRQTPEEERFLMTKEEIEAKVRITLAGRAAEEVILGKITTGASNDLEKVNDIIRTGITMYGLYDEFKNISFERATGQYLNGGSRMLCSPEMQYEIDKFIIKEIDRLYKETLKMIKTHKKMIKEIANYLYTEETITGKKFLEICKNIEENGSIYLNKPTKA